jgi:hypothetical protein
MALPIDSPLRTGDMETQRMWHKTYRDMADNMYRTSYQDMIHGREVSVKNDFPAGYGGHVPSVRHDVLFRNTEFDRMNLNLKKDAKRDKFPDFDAQNRGVPTLTKFPRGMACSPTAGCCPDILVKPPWALTLSLRSPLTFRESPPTTLRRPQTTPHSARGNLSARQNRAAVRAGQSAFLEDRIGTANSTERAVAAANEVSSKQGMPSEVEVLTSVSKSP